jgi:hypothetical protein
VRNCFWFSLRKDPLIEYGFGLWINKKLTGFQGL